MILFQKFHTPLTKLTINYISDMHDLNHSLKTDIEDRESLYMFIVQWAR